MQRYGLAGLTIVFAGFSFLPAARAETIRVEDGQSLQKAVDAAQDDDIILVGDGNYPELVIVCGKDGLKIVSENLYGARMHGDGKTKIGFRDCEYRFKVSDAEGAPNTYIKGFWISDAYGYNQGGVNTDNETAANSMDMEVIGAGRGWVIDSVKIERAAEAIVLSGHDGTVADTIVDDVEGGNAHFFHAEIPHPTSATPRLRNITVSRATFTGCNNNGKNAAVAWTNCSKMMNTDNTVWENVLSSDHKSSALWFDWRNRNYVIRFSRFSGMQIANEERKFMAAAQLEGNQAGENGPVPDLYDDGSVCFNAFEDNEFADLTIAETSNVEIYRNTFEGGSGFSGGTVAISVRDGGSSWRADSGGYPVSWVDIRDNTLGGDVMETIPAGEHENSVVTEGLRGNRVRGSSGETLADDLAKCSVKVRPSVYGQDCLGAFCGMPEAEAKKRYDPLDFDPMRLDGE